MIIVASTESIHSDPRTGLVIQTLCKHFGSVRILQIQTLRPSLRQIWGSQTGTILDSCSIDGRTVDSSWSARSSALDHFGQMLCTRSNDFPELEAAMRTGSLTPAESFLPNRMALAYESLAVYLRSRNLLGERAKAIVAEDLPSALAAVLLRNDYDFDVVYDSHELFYEAIRINSSNVSPVFLNVVRSTEERLWKLVSTLVTVSPEISSIMSESAGGRAVLTLPNFSSLASSKQSIQRVPTFPRRFAYFGGASVHRNVDLLVANWPQHREAPTLSLYMPPSDHAVHVESLAKHNRNVVVRRPVEPSEMISEMSLYDFGVIPYAYPYPYSFASPNKFGEYLAAGIPVIAHSQPFTSTLIHEYELGVTCDLTSPADLYTAIHTIVNLNYDALRENVLRAFQQSLNWESVAGPLVDAVAHIALSKSETSRLPFNGNSLSVPNSSRKSRLIEYLIDTARSIIPFIFRGRVARFLTRLIPSRILRRLV